MFLFAKRARRIGMALAIVPFAACAKDDANVVLDADGIPADVCADGKDSTIAERDASDANLDPGYPRDPQDSPRDFADIADVDSDRSPIPFPQGGGSLACGTNVCNSDEVCIHPCQGVDSGAPSCATTCDQQEGGCSGDYDAGACPPGYAYVDACSPG